MRVYISLPMAGHETTVRKRYQEAYNAIKYIYPSAEITGPQNLADFSEAGRSPKAEEHPWAWFIGEDVKVLLECTHIYLCQGWSDSKGCRTELAVAKANKIRVIKKDDADSMLKD